MVEITNKQLIAGIFILVTLVGTTYYISDKDNAYYCENENSVGICIKLSAINDNGLQTRCYYNESDLTRYNYCKSGWIKYQQQEVTGTPIEINKIEILDGNYYLYKLSDKYNEQELLTQLIVLNTEIKDTTEKYDFFKNERDSRLNDCLIGLINSNQYRDDKIADCYTDLEVEEQGYLNNIEDLNESINYLNSIIEN